jgi:hypothetical protein
MQAWIIGLYDTSPILRKVSHLQKKPALSPRLAVIVTKIGHQEQSYTFFCPQKRVRSTGVLMASVGGKFVPHGQTCWQPARSRRHQRLRVNFFNELYLLVLVACMPAANL